MKPYQLAFYLVIIFLIASSCQNSVIYEEYKYFDDNRWNRLDFLVFDVPVDDTESSYKIDFCLTHSKELSYDEIPLVISIHSPSGEQRARDYEIRLKNYEDQFIGKELDGNYQVQMVVKSQLKFSEAGICRIKINHKLDRIYVTGFVHAHLKVEKL